MRQKLFIILLFLMPVLLFAQLQVLVPTDIGSSVTFSIKNFGIGVDGNFSNLKGSVMFDPNNISASSFNVTIDAATINTGNASRDRHLRKEDYFDVSNHPVIKISSTKVAHSNKAGTYFLFATLNIKNKVKEISFPFTATASGSGFLFDGKFTINRRDFEVGSSSISLSDNLTVQLSVLAK